MEQGVYKIATFMDTGVLIDVAYISKANGANVMLCASNGGNNQKFLLQNLDSTYFVLWAVHSGKVVDLDRKMLRKGQNIMQCAWNGGNNQIWSVSNVSACTINGQRYDSKAIRTKMNSNWVLDAEGEKTADGTNVMIFPYHGHNNHQWVFIKDSRWDSTFAVPANIGLSTSVIGERNTTVSCNASPSTFYPYWQCEGQHWQLRWRWRGRRTGTNTWSGWTNWYSISNTSVPNGSNADEGWGDAWESNVYASGDGNVRHSTEGIGINIDQGTYDKKEIQIEVRKFDKDNITINGVPISTHGSSATQTVTAVYRPSLLCSEIALSPAGLRIPVTSDFRRNGNTAYINSITVNGKKLVSNFRASNIPYNNAMIEIPVDQLAFIPDDGDTAKMSVKYTTTDGTWTYALSPEIRYNANHGISLSPVFSKSDGWTERAKLDGSYAESHCWLVTDNEGRTGFSECEKDDSGMFIVVPPLGKPYELFFSAENSNGWGTYSVTRPAMTNCKYYLFNWNDGYAVLPWDAEASWSLDRDTDTVQTQGRYFESVFFGKGSSRPITISGRLLENDNVTNSSFFDFEKLSVSDYAIVRFPTGERYDASIEKVSFKTSHRRYREVTVTCREVS